MFVADLRLTLAILGGVIVVAILLRTVWVSPLRAGLLLTLICLAVLAEAIFREVRIRGRKMRS